jgi:FMN phosphatase YigB (HAD superfamily)
MSSSSAGVVFLFDVDNTLLDTDRVTTDLHRFVAREVSAQAERDYFALFEERRNEMGYADYLGALQRYRDLHPEHTQIIQVSLYLLNYHFANRLFPNALDVIEAVKQFGKAAILSDGDVVFQPYKIENAGLWEAFDGNVLIYIHKEHELAAVEAAYPADHYVMIDDKLRILDAMKMTWGARLTTVFVRQGHYAHDPRHLQGYRAADVTIERIGDLLQVDINEMLAVKDSY